MSVVLWTSFELEEAVGDDTSPLSSSEDESEAEKDEVNALTIDTDDAM